MDDRTENFLSRIRQANARPRADFNQENRRSNRAVMVRHLSGNATNQASELLRACPSLARDIPALLEFILGLDFAVEGFCQQGPSRPAESVLGWTGEEQCRQARAPTLQRMRAVLLRVLLVLTGRSPVRY